MNDFIVIKELGKGSFGTVYKVKRKIDGKIYAMKKVCKIKQIKNKIYVQIRLRDDNEADREIEIKNALNEVRVLASIDHPNVIGYRDAFVSKDDNSLCLILEYADGGNLQEYIEFLEQKNKLMPEQEALNIFIQIILGLRALHKMRIIHRDLKTANIFLTRDKQVKIGDMNVAKVLKGQFGTTQTGTPYYAGPEIWLQSPQYLAVDIWSMGCILFEMLAYYPPYNGKDMKLLAQSIVRDPVIDIPLEYSQELNMLVKNLLQKNPLKRPTCDQILEINLVQQLFTNMPQYDQYIKEIETQEEKKQKKYDQSKMVSTIRQPRDFYFMVKNDFPKPNFPIQEVQAPINKYENQRDDNFSLFWKSKKREKQELLKKFRFIGQDDIKIPFKKIAQYEQEKIQRLKDEDELNEQFILKKRNHRRLQALEDGKEKQEPIFTHKVGVLIGMDSLEYKQKQENLKIIRKKMEVIKDSQDQILFYQQILAPLAFDMPYDDRLLNELQNYANEKLTETHSQKLDETSMSYKYGYRDKFLDTQNNLLAQNKQPVRVAKFRDEDRRVKLNMFQALNIGIKLRNMKEKEIDQNIDIKQDFDNIIAKRNDEDLFQSQKLSNLMGQQQQKKRAKSRTFQNKHSVTFIQPEQQQDNSQNNIQRNISPFIKSAQNVLNNLSKQYKNCEQTNAQIQRNIQYKYLKHFLKIFNLISIILKMNQYINLNQIIITYLFMLLSPLFIFIFLVNIFKYIQFKVLIEMKFDFFKYQFKFIHKQKHEQFSNNLLIKAKNFLNQKNSMYKIYYLSKQQNSEQNTFYISLKVILQIKIFSQNTNKIRIIYYQYNRWAQVVKIQYLQLAPILNIIKSKSSKFIKNYYNNAWRMIFLQYLCILRIQIQTIFNKF